MLVSRFMLQSGRSAQTEAICLLSLHLECGICPFGLRGVFCVDRQAEFIDPTQCMQVTATRRLSRILVGGRRRRGLMLLHLRVAAA